MFDVHTLSLFWCLCCWSSPWLLLLLRTNTTAIYCAFLPDKRENIGRLIVVAAGYYLLARWPKQERMLILRSERPADVAERRIVVHETRVDEALEAHKVLFLAKARQEARAECERVKALFDRVQQRLGARKAQRNMRRVRVAHVVRRLHVIVNKALARAAKRLDREKLAFL